MTETALPNGRTEGRLTAVETGLRHFREIQEMRQQHIDRALTELKEQNRQQDNDLETMEEKLLSKIEAIYALLWSGMKWGGGLIAATLLTIVLKALNLL